ncbi:ABC transporter permease family protein [Paenibacillus riograndensis]|uniref:hypothetical protein n=1 Tax=Paenibacillus riograndensis TaxID=483937 RepID=UPI0002E31278
MFPIAVVIFGSLKTNLELTTGATILPAAWEFGNYATAWKTANFSRFTWNSIFVSTMTTAGSLLVSAMAAYAVDRVSKSTKPPEDTKIRTVIEAAVRHFDLP